MCLTNIEKVKNSKNVWTVDKYSTKFLSRFYKFDHETELFMYSIDNVEWFVSSINEDYTFINLFNNAAISEIVPNQQTLTNIEKIKNSKNVWENLDVKHSSFYRYYRYNHNANIYERSDDCMMWLESQLGSMKEYWSEGFNKIKFREIMSVQKELTNIEKIKNSKNVWKNLNINENTFATYYRFNHELNCLECSYNNTVWINSFVNGCSLTEAFNKVSFVELINENTNTIKETNNLSPLELLMTNPDQEFLLSDGQYTIYYQWSSQMSCLKSRVHQQNCYNVTDIKSFIDYSRSELQRGATFLKYEKKNLFKALCEVPSPRHCSLQSTTNESGFNVVPTLNIDLTGNFSNRNNCFNEKLSIQEIDRQIELLQYVKELKKVFDSQ